MQKDVILSPEEQLFLLNLPHRLRSTWIVWRMGIDPYYFMARQTFYTHADLLEKYNVFIRGDNPHARKFEDVNPPAPDKPFYEPIDRGASKKEVQKAQAIAQVKGQLDLLGDTPPTKSPKK